MSCDIEYLKKQLLFLEQNRNFPKRLCVRSKNVFLSSGVLVALVVTKKSVLRTSSDLSTWNNTCFLFKCRVTFGCASFRRLGLVFWLFTSCVWDVLQYRILRKKQLLIFSETWSSSYCNVCNCFDDFRTNLPKSFGRFRRKKNTNFPKWRWVRSKKVCLSSALLFSLVVTQKHFLRPYWGLSLWNNTWFLFKCRVTLRLRQFSKGRFGIFALYFLRLRCLVISNT